VEFEANIDLAAEEIQFPLTLGSIVTESCDESEKALFGQPKARRASFDWHESTTPRW